MGQQKPRHATQWCCVSYWPWICSVVHWVEDSGTEESSSATTVINLSQGFSWKYCDSAKLWNQENVFGFKRDVGAKSVGLFVTVRPLTEQWDRRKDFLELLSSEVPAQHDRESRVGQCCSHPAGQEIENFRAGWLFFFSLSVSGFQPLRHSSPCLPNWGSVFPFNNSFLETPSQQPRQVLSWSLRQDPIQPSQ